MYLPHLSISENLLVNCAQAFSRLDLHVRRSRLLSPDTQPDEIRTYPVCPHLGDHRVFIPKFLSSPSSPSTTARPQRVPLVISAHGSAFCLGNPSDDDPLNRAVADRSGAVVVGINYSKAPQNPFPRGHEDVIALIGAVIDDPWLPIDRSRVVLMGGSAGGNLLLGAHLNSAIQKRNIRGIAAICAPVDMFTSKEEKLARRRRQHVPDLLAPFFDTIRGTYLGKEGSLHQDMQDVRLSPTLFRSRSDYPKRMYFVGFEDDVLCAEEEDMAEKLAGGKDATKVTTRRGWTSADGNVVWEMIDEQPHGFYPPFNEGAPQKAHRLEEVESLYDRLAIWVRETCAQAEGTGTAELGSRL